MKLKQWNLVDPAGQGGEKLPAGGYVIRITKVEDNDKDEYLTVRYDVAEGEHTGHFSDDFGESHPYVHEFRRYYSDKAQNFFAQFLHAIEESTPEFSIERWQTTCNPFELEGCVLGAVFQYERYTNQKGEDKERSNFIAAYPAQDIREGNFKVPEVKDSRESAKGSAYGYNPYRDGKGKDAHAADEYIPFN